MKFEIEQWALALPREPAARAAAWELLGMLGILDWVEDRVHARGDVEGHPGVIVTNVANLRFNYTALEKSRELEVLSYESGQNWLENVELPRVSHIGMHVTETELSEWRVRLAPYVSVVQEVFTKRHTNPIIAGKRWYHYVVFGAAHLIGVDIKFIVRRDEE
jgi:hypothetical protein